MASASSAPAPATISLVGIVNEGTRLSAFNGVTHAVRAGADMRLVNLEHQLVDASCQASFWPGLHISRMRGGTGCSE